MTGFAKKNPPQSSVENPAPTSSSSSSAAPTGSASSSGSIQLSRFEKAVRYVMENEDGVRWDHDDGEFTDDPRDPGGATMWGIIKTEYEGFVGHDLTTSDIKAMPRETAMAIYRKNFWVPINGDAYASDAVATAIMDTAVNKGLGGCMVILTDALQQHFQVRYGADLIATTLQSDQAFLLKSIEAATLRYIDARVAAYPNMTWARGGWTNRAARLLTLIPAV